MITFPDRLKQLKKENRILQKDIAGGVGLSVRAYQAYEYGEKEPTIGNLIKLCRYFNVSADYLLGLSDEPRPLDNPNSD